VSVRWMAIAFALFAILKAPTLSAQAAADTVQLRPVNDSGTFSTSWEKISLCFDRAPYPSAAGIIKDADQRVLLMVPPGEARPPSKLAACKHSARVSQIASTVRITPAAAVALFGKGFELGVTITTLTFEGTAAWRRSAESVAALVVCDPKASNGTTAPCSK
jgi:hypothetical protein